MNRTLLIATLLVLTAVGVNAQKVAVGSDRSADFSKFKTYTWTKGVPAKSPVIDQQIIASIEAELAKAGLTRASENGDLNISYHAALFQDFDQANVAAPQSNPGSVAWVPHMGSMTQVWQVMKGSLIVAMKNHNGQDVWRGAATDTFDEDIQKTVAKNPDKAARKVKKVVEKLFKGFPPGR